MKLTEERRTERVLTLIRDIQDLVIRFPYRTQEKQDAKEGLLLIKIEDIDPFFEYLKERERCDTPKRWRRVQGFLYDLGVWVGEHSTLDDRVKFDAFRRFLESYADLFAYDLGEIKAKQKEAGKRGEVTKKKRETTYKDYFINFLND